MRKPFFLTLAGGLLLAGCGDKSPRSAVAKEPESSEQASVAVAGPEVTPVADSSTPTPTVTGPVTFDQANSAFREKQYEDAVQLFTAYTERRPENAWGFYMLGLSAWKAGARPRAEAAFKHALEIDSTHVKSYLNLSRVLLESGRPDEALEYLGTVLTIDSTLGAGYRLLGRAHDARGEIDQAIVANRRAIVLDTTDVWAMNNLGLILIRQGEFEEALKPLARATELSPMVAVFQNNLGMALERTGHFTAAAEAYRAATAADSGAEKAAANLARVSSLTEEPGLAPVDIKALSESFGQDVAKWREEVPATGDR